MIVAHHLKRVENVSNEDIKWLIEKKCPPLLRAIREKHEIEGNDFLNPSDVHSYLVNNKTLSESMFRGVCGGSILNDKHMDSLLQLLKASNTKTGATFFLKEHVVSIIKLQDDEGKFAYDIIETLPPGTQTRCRDIDALAAALKSHAFRLFQSSDVEKLYEPFNEKEPESHPTVYQVCLQRH